MMGNADKKVCPECNGEKVIQGTCECNSEWRGSKVGEEWNDCQCVPQVVCPVCKGTGFVESL
jgi:hypothetical protein